jgi:hypothetical protein
MLLATLSMSAQAPGPSGPAETVKYFPDVSGCPIAMHARQGIGGRLSAARNGHHAEKFAAHLQLGLNDGHVKSAPQMLRARVIVHGLNGNERILPAMGGAGHADIIRTFTVNLAPDEEPGMAGELVLPGFTSARLIELESVTYTDGSTWKFSNPSACRAVPDMLMRIASQ